MKIATLRPHERLRPPGRLAPPIRSGRIVPRGLLRPLSLLRPLGSLRPLGPLRLAGLFAAIATLGLPASLRAQEVEVFAPTRVEVGGGLLGAVSTGEFADFVDGGFGFGGSAHYRLVPSGVAGLGVIGGFIIYGSERNRVCLSPTVTCRIEVDVTTTNSIAFIGFGPRLALPDGRVRPYLDGFGGVAYFSTSSSVSGTRSQDGDFASTRNFSDATFAWGGGGGLQVLVSGGATPVALDVAVRYHDNGTAEYLREGDIEDLPNGEIVLHPTRSDTNFVTIMLGVSVGLRPSLR